MDAEEQRLRNRVHLAVLIFIVLVPILFTLGMFLVASSLDRPN